MRKHYANIAGALLYGALFFMAQGLVAMEFSQGVLAPSSVGLSWWQFLLVVFSPGAAAVLSTMLWVRYQRAFALEDGEDRSNRYWFRYTLAAGAFFGLVCQLGLQGAVNYLTGMPIMLELLLVAVFITGIASMATYKALRWWLRRQFADGRQDLETWYNWLGATPGG